MREQKLFRRQIKEQRLKCPYRCRLRRSANAAREASARILGDMLMAIAVMTDSRGLQLDDAVRVMSRCSEDDALQTLLDRGGFGFGGNGGGGRMAVAAVIEEYEFLPEA